MATAVLAPRRSGTAVSEHGKVPVSLAWVARVCLACAGMNLWVFNIGLRIFIFDVLVALFLFVAVTSGAMWKPARLSRVAKTFFGFIAVRVALIVFSGVLVMWQGTRPDALPQFLKGAASLLTYLAFLFCLVRFFGDAAEEEKTRLLRWYVAGVLASAALELLELWLLKVYGIEIDAPLWDTLSYGDARDPLQSYLARYEWSYLYRGTGFSGGPNAQGTYIATILPWLILSISDKFTAGRVFALTLATTGLIFTQSRTGFVALLVGLVVAISIAVVKRLPWRIGVLLLTLFVGTGWIVFADDVANAVQYRNQVDETRLEMYRHSWQVFFANPLGAGLNQYATVMHGPGGDPLSDPNPHSSWIGVLVEEGLPGVLWYFAFVVFLVRALVKTGGVTGAGLAGAVVGVAAAAIVNTTFDQFYILSFWGVALTLCGRPCFLSRAVNAAPTLPSSRRRLVPAGVRSAAAKRGPTAFAARFTNWS